MRLKKGTDINLSNAVYYELVNSLDVTVLTIWQSNTGEIRISGVGWDDSFDEVAKLLEKAKMKLTVKH